MSKPVADRERTLTEWVRDVTELLEQIVADRRVLENVAVEDKARLLRAVSSVSRPNGRTRRRLEKSEARRARASRMQQDEAVRADTGIRALRRKPVVNTPNVFLPPFPNGRFEPNDRSDDVLPDGSVEREVLEPRSCYVCKEKYAAVHHFYDQLCPACAELNLVKRTETADLRGRVALVTGGRVKIGYQAALKLLRSGAHVIVTTRFPRDSAMRFSREADFEAWHDRLEIFGLDLRHTPSVEAFCRELLTTRARLDFIVNNACQTVRRPPDFYAHMMELETAATSDMPEPLRKLLGAYEGLRGYHLLPEGRDGSVGLAHSSRSDVAGLVDAARLSQVPLLPFQHSGIRSLEFT